MRESGTLILVAGIVLVLVGVLAMTGALSWFGRLPGDIRGGSGSVRVYAPLTSMLLVSVVLSVVLAVARRFF